MPTYSEIAHLLQGQPNSLDGLRLYFMQQLVAHTKRPLVVYAANPNPPVNCSSLMIDDSQVIACENVGATWLPFQPWRIVKANESRTGGKKSEEAIWLGGPQPPTQGSLFT